MNLYILTPGIWWNMQELMSQAAQILGSVDFLGNPMGLLNDVSEGVSELIKYGNVGGLIRNVTHGVSNSAAKVFFWILLVRL